MRTLTKLFCTAFLLIAGYTGANAQEDEIINLTADMFYSWNGYGADAISTGAATVDFNVGTEFTAGGSMVAGTSSVDYLIYADLTGCTKMIFEGTKGLALRVLMNRQESNSGPLVEKNLAIGDNCTAELDLTELEYVHLNAIKTGWGDSGIGTLTAIKLVKPTDPLAIYKENLKNTISAAKMKHSYGKTQASWNALLAAINSAESALASENASQTSLENAMENLNNAMAGLQLMGGFASVRNDMFHKWTTPDADAEMTSDAVYPANEVGKGIGQGATILGFSSVNYLQYANLTGCNKIIITGTPGLVARLCLNRVEPLPEGTEGRDANGGAYIEIIEALDEYGVLEIDLKNHEKLQGAEFIHLNSFKTPWNGMTGYFADVLLQFDYSITGELTGGWDKDVDMVSAGTAGRYTLTVEGFEAEAKAYNYKMRAAHQWNFIYQLPGEGDATWNCEEAGTYNLTFTADVFNHELNVNAEKVEIPHTYTLAGAYKVGEEEQALFFGEIWNPALDANLMTKQEDGTYTISFENVTFEQPGTILYKVCEDKDWTVSYGFNGNNADYIINEACTAEKVTFTFNPNAEGYKVSCTVKFPDSELMKEAKALAADADGVAVGKLLAAIETAEASDETGLQAAIDQFKADNADQEKDETAKVAVDWQKWTGATGFATWAAPQVTTYDGRTTYVVENYNGGSGSVTGEIFSQTITGLSTGDYKVAFFANANSTADRDTAVETGMEDGATDVAYVFANDAQEFIVAHRATSIESNGEYSFEMTLTEADNGTIKLGLGKAKAGTNWHTMQIKQLTWFTTAKEVYAELQAELTALIAEAEALTGSADKTALEAAIATATEATTTKANWYNITEIEAIIASLKEAANAYEIANRFTYNGVAYVIDTESGKFMAAGHDYGTRGIVNNIGLDLTFSANADNTVDIETGIKNNDTNHFLGSNLYMDSSSYGWILLEQDFGFYIQNVEGKYISVDYNENLVMSDTPHLWLIVTPEGVKETRLNEMKEATAENPVDVTWMIKAQGFNRNDVRNSSWNTWSEQEGGNQNLNICGGADANRCAESYHAHFYVKQTIEGAPAGIYKMTAQGFYRQDDSAEEAAPVFFIGSKTADVPVKTGEENSMADASNSFANGQYTIEPIEFKLYADGNIELGVKQEEAFHQWVIFDNFKLEYYGPAEIETYTVAGSFKPAGEETQEEASFFGEAWTPTIEANDLVKGADGVYTKTFENVELNAGTIYYKVVADHSWDAPNWGFGDNNADYVVSMAGTYNITFSFDPNNLIDPEGKYNLTCTVEDVENPATGINSVAASTIENGAVYNLNGQRVMKAQKGLYIINGKKQVVK